jgi:hypothetical protein
MDRTILERTRLLESLNIVFPQDEDVNDEAIDIYMQVMQATNILVDECLRLKKELEERDLKLNCMALGSAIIADEQCGDAVFKLKRGMTRAHTSVVSAWSDPIAAMFDSGMYEGRNKCIEITTEEPEYVRMMLKYFYTGRAHINSETVFPLLRLSCLYAVDLLRNECCEYLLTNIDAANCMAVMSIADLHEFEDFQMWNNLRMKAWEYAILHFPDIMEVNSSPFSEMNLVGLVEYLESLPDLLRDKDENAKENAGLLSTAVVVWAKQLWSNVTTLSHMITRVNSEIALYKMQLFVKVSGNTLSVFIKKTSIVHDLKVELARSSGIPVELQRLTFEGKVINSSESLAECNIMTDCTVHLSATQQPTKTRPSESSTVPLGELDYLETLRAFCICIMAADFTVQSSSQEFLDLDYESFLSVMQENIIDECEESVVLNAAYNWLTARPDRNTALIINQIASSGCPHLRHLPNLVEPQRKRKRCVDMTLSRDLPGAVGFGMTRQGEPQRI